MSYIYKMLINLNKVVKIEDDEIIRRLQPFGLTRYEAEVYLLLLKYKVLTATKLGEMSKVPITRIYDIAQSLAEKGLIGVVNQNPKQYGILPLKNSFKSLILKKKEEYENEIKRLEKEHIAVMKHVSNMPNSDAPKTQDFVFSINGKRPILKAWHSVFSDTKKEIFILSGDADYTVKELPRFQRMLNKGVDVRMLANAKNLNQIKKVADIGVKVKLSDNALRGFIADRKYLYIPKKFTSATRDEDYSCFFTEHKGMVESLREYFLMKWDAGKDISV